MVEPKYRIGQEVFKINVTWKAIPVTCPDCLGQREWVVTTPAGESFACLCATCRNGYDGASGAIDRWDYHGYIEHLHIGQIQYKETSLKSEIEYMCHETGVGSGTIHGESTLMATLREAEERLPHAVKETRERAQLAKKAAQIRKEKKTKKNGMPRKQDDNRLADWY